MGDLEGTPTPYRTYPATTAALEGIMVWFRDQRIVLVGVPHPTLVEPLETSLGAPEGKERSLLASGATQWIYATRGIVSGRMPGMLEQLARVRKARRPRALQGRRITWHRRALIEDQRAGLRLAFEQGEQITWLPALREQIGVDHTRAVQQRAVFRCKPGHSTRLQLSMIL